MRKPADEVWSGPLVVITNRATAGGAEIAAAALLDDKRAEVIGERSYGDASLAENHSDGRRRRGHPLGG